ncbi:MAG: ribosome-associated translation inhibitor RaiA [Bacteroidales bacterium]|nr:ribosome-associated translation inhibitor RaiA [Bacteroidales bacterium]
MEIRIQAVHFDASEHLVAFVEKKVSKFEQYFDGILSVEITLKVVKPETANNKEVNIKVNVPHNELLFSEKICDSFEAAVDECATAISKQLHKLKEKTR